MIWIIGNHGMLGRELQELLRKEGLETIGTDLEVDILSRLSLEIQFQKCQPDWIINCSAYTAVDKAENDREYAYRINEEGVGNIAWVAQSHNVPLVHISTDYVFDGTSDIPLTESAATSPIGVYGASKLAGEELIRKMCNKYFIIRTAWLYGQFGTNFVYTMLNLMKSKPSLKVVNDQKGTPTWTKDLSGLISRIIGSNSRDYGLYHFSGEGECSWFDFASEIYCQGREKGMIQNDCTISPCSSDEYPTAARRPSCSLLSKEKVKTNFQFGIAPWEISLNQFLEEIKDAQ